jgi:hypothetical protein
MGTNAIGMGGTTQVHVDAAVSRKTEKPRERGFGALVGGAADLALRGVELGATVVGGPIVGAAVRGVRVGVGVASGGTVGAVPSGPLSASAGGGAGGTAAVAAGADAQESSTLTEVRAMQEQAQAFNLQYLSLQEEVQQENRRFSTVSNVLKAKHETAKAAVSNIRA